MLSLGFNGIEQVPNFVAAIIQPGSRIYHENARLRGDIRVSVVHSPIGTAILEYRGTRGNPSYLVITAYLKTRADGTLVGTVR
jgi:hypothetical protein